MNKKEFLKELRKRLRNLPSGDVEKYIEYYEEMIDDSMEDGISEEDAIDAIGSMDEIVEMIGQERGEKEKKGLKSKISVWQIVLLILGLPIWGSLLIAAISAVISLYAAIWSVIISLYAADLTLAFCGCFGMVRFVMLIVNGSSFAHILLALGIGLLGIGFSLLLFFGTNALTKLVVRFTKFLFCSCKKSFQRKRREK